MREMLAYSHAKNVKSALKNLLEKLRKQQNAATAAAENNDKISTPEGDDSGEGSGDEAPKKPGAKKSARAKKGKAAEEVNDAAEASEEDESAKKVVKKAPAAKKGAAAKKGVGKTTAPKKASAGGPKPAAKRKGKKAAKAEEAEDEAEVVDAKVEGEDNDDDDDDNDDDAAAAAKGEEGDMKDPGKSLDSLPNAPTPSNAAPSEGLTTLATAGAMTGPPLYITIRGDEYTYTPYDVYVANSHEITLEHWLEWKKFNFNYDDWLDPVPYYPPVFQGAAVEGSDKV
jgi:hypothetical protein